MFLLGVFLGNIGVGCPYPATPLLLMNALVSGSGVYGALLFFLHALGRILPLALLYALFLIRVDGSSWLVKHKQRIDKANGWLLVFLSGFILTLGLFSHAWVSGGKVAAFVKVAIYPGYLSEDIVSSQSLGLLHLPLQYGNLLLVLLVLAPLWLYYFIERRRVHGSPTYEILRLTERIDKLEEERRGFDAALHIREGSHRDRILLLMRQIDVLEMKRRILEDSTRYPAREQLGKAHEEHFEATALALRRNWYITLSILLVTIVTLLL